MFAHLMIIFPFDDVLNSLLNTTFLHCMLISLSEKKNCFFFDIKGKFKKNGKKKIMTCTIFLFNNIVSDLWPKVSGGYCNDWRCDVMWCDVNWMNATKRDQNDANIVVLIDEQQTV